MKIVDTSKQDQDREMFLKEVRLIRKLGSQFIIRYFDDFRVSDVNYCIIIELCEVYMVIYGLDFFLNIYVYCLYG